MTYRNTMERWCTRCGEPYSTSPCGSGERGCTDSDPDYRWRDPCNCGGDLWLTRRYKPEEDEEGAPPQPQRCDCCKRATGALNKDHDHVTGLFRGWVCTACNNALPSNFCQAADTTTYLCRHYGVHMKEAT